MTERMPPGALEGVRVLELGRGIAAAYAGMQLADLGAEVVHVEPAGGDPLRAEGSVVPGTSKRFQWLNRGKRSLVLDLASERARDVIARLVPGFDVVCVALPPGETERLRCDYEALAALRADLIYLRLSGYGPSGPLADQEATDSVAAAYVGALAMEETVDEAGAPLPIRTPAVAEMATGLSCAIGVCAALLHRALSGEGQRIDVSLVRSAASVTGGSTPIMREPVTDTVLRDPMYALVEEVRARGGSYTEVLAARATGPRGNLGIADSPHRLFYSTYVARDGAIVLGSLTPANRRAARAVLGVPDEGGDRPDYNAIDEDNQRLVRARKQEIRAIMRTRTVAEWVADFHAAGVPVAPVSLPEEVADEPQPSLFMRVVDDPLTGPQRQVAPIVDMAATPTAIRGPAPLAGADSASLLREAGFAAAEIEELRAAGVFGGVAGGAAS